VFHTLTRMHIPDTIIADAFKAKKVIYFLGINGIGLSALAQYFKSKGFAVRGSCDGSSPVTKLLEEKGISFETHHDATFITDDIACVFYTVAIPDENPELQEIKKRGIPLFTYAEGLGFISRKSKTIAVAGSHGKTTTTAMIADILIKAGLKPTVIVGSMLSLGRGNFIEGSDDYFVVEACEYKKSFLEISPTVSIITNIDNDHLDYYKTMENLVEAFNQFAKNTKESIVVHSSLPYIKEATAEISGTIKNADEEDVDFKLRVPGKHIIANAQCALAAADLLGIDRGIAKSSLQEFQGTWRRSQYKGVTKTGAQLYDDYAHHPTEIATTIQGFKDAYPNKKIVVLFQPHLFSRTKILFSDFVSALTIADAVWFAPIYHSREVDDGTISSEDLVRATNEKGGGRAFLFTGDLSVFNALGEDTILITMGAGDIYKEGDVLLAK